VSGTAETEKGTLANVYAAPLGMGTNQTTGTTYMTVEGGGMKTATRDAQSISIYWGSIDDNARGKNNLNSLAITVDGYTLTGAEVSLGALRIGDRNSPKDD
jgi:hypothetical protein